MAPSKSSLLQWAWASSEPFFKHQQHNGVIVMAVVKYISRRGYQCGFEVACPAIWSGPTSLTAVHGRSISHNSGIPTLKIGVLVIPQESSEDIEPSTDSYVLEVIDGKEQGRYTLMHTLQDLGEKLLPKAVDYLRQNSESKMYQMSLKSRHGTAHLCVEKARIQIQTASMAKSETTRCAQNKWTTNLQQDIERWKRVSEDLLKLWVVHGSDKLQGSIISTRNLA